MLAIERKNEILAKLRAEQRVLVRELAAHYGVTEETIRRDLDKLEKEGFATKTYGGAIWGNSTKTDLSYTIRNKTNVEAKTAIATVVSQMVRDGDHLMLDDSSTSLYSAKQLKDKKDLTILTYSMEIAMELSGVDGWNVICTGGALKPGTLSFTGPQVAQTLSRFHVDKAILSCKGFDRNAGITDSAESHAVAKQAMIRNARHVILALDNTKLDKISFVQIVPGEQIQTVVTNEKPPKEWQEYFRTLGLNLHYPE